MNTSRTRRTWSAVVITAVAAALTLGGVQAAHADPTVDTSPSKRGSITIHKHEQSTVPSTTQATGSLQTVDESVHPPLSNIGFTVTPLNGVDLRTDAGWATLAGYQADFDPFDAPNFGLPSGTLGTESDELHTSLAGVVEFDNLPLGAYLVRETDWSEPRDASGELINKGVTPSLPFVITVPLTSADGTAWVYDVHAYPKNALSGVVKSVADASAVALGDTITYTILADIPSGVAHDDFVIRDVFDAKLTYDADETTVRLLGTGAPLVLDQGLPPVPDGGGVLPVPDDFYVTVAGSTVDVVIDNAIIALQNYLQVEVTHTVSVNAAGEISNVPLLFPNAAAVTANTPTTGLPVETRFGNIVIENQTAAGDPIAGARFSVFRTQSDARAGTNPIAIGSSGAQTVFTSDSAGLAVISGLRFSDFANGVVQATADAGYRTYWVAQVEAAATYELLAEPIEVVVNSVSTTAVTETLVSVPKSAGFQLPFTGGTLPTALIATGIAIALIGCLLLVLRRRRRA